MLAYHRGKAKEAELAAQLESVNAAQGTVSAGGAGTGSIADQMLDCVCWWFAAAVASAICLNVLHYNVIFSSPPRPPGARSATRRRWSGSTSKNSTACSSCAARQTCCAARWGRYATGWVAATTCGKALCTVARGAA